MEWMVIENIRNFGKVELSLDACKKLVNLYSGLMKRELTERKLLFAEFDNDLEYLSKITFSFKNRENIDESKCYIKSGIFIKS
jgi:hypothetical protein